MSAAFSEGLAKFVSGIEQLKKLPAEAAESLSSAIEEDLSKKFSRGQGPYGEKWKPRTSGGAWPLLDKSGYMKSTRKVSVVQAMGRTVLVIRYAAKVAGFHDKGTWSIPQRKLVPEGKKLPKEWLASFKAAVKKLFKEQFK
jgi:hypothetical protein